jgi:hypothetical protein
MLSDKASKHTAYNDLGIIINKDCAVLYDFASNKQKYYKWNAAKPREMVLTEVANVPGSALSFGWTV